MSNTIVSATTMPISPATATPAATVPAVGHAPVDWLTYLVADDTASLKRAANAAGVAFFIGDGEARREYLESVVGYFLLAQTARHGQPAAANAFLSRMDAAKGAKAKAIKALKDANARLVQIGVKAPNVDKITIAATCYLAMVDILVNAGLLRQEKAIRYLLEEGKAVDREQAGQILEAAKEEKAAKAFAKKAAEAGFIRKDEAEAEAARMRARIIQLEAQRDAMQAKLEAMESAMQAALMANTLKAAKAALAV